jgi:hypothetical protein
MCSDAVDRESHNAALICHTRRRGDVLHAMLNHPALCNLGTSNPPGQAHRP